MSYPPTFFPGAPRVVTGAPSVNPPAQYSSQTASGVSLGCAGCGIDAGADLGAITLADVARRPVPLWLKIGLGLGMVGLIAALVRLSR